MVDTTRNSLNGDLEEGMIDVYQLPELVHLTAAEARRIPSPGAQRDLKAQTGRGFDQLCGPEADGADRIQTLIWIQLRRQFPGLRWDACSEITVQVEEGALDVDPTKLVDSATLPSSVDSGD